MSEFPSEAERRASEACDLSVGGGLSLAQTRKELKELLGRIGSFGFFDEYTKHDISHIDTMLGTLDWLVTPKTREAMTPADWLLIVLAVYFHDLGMLVTKSEFARREESDFPRFCAEIRNASDSDSRDYLARLDVLGEEERERFLYQEFVRHHHAARVRKWITGETSPNLGATDRVVTEIQNLLRSLDETFREDLAKVCESHHLDDLYDVKKYPVKQYYGASERERANVQFAAILLRSTDLLHITRDRTPSIAFRVLNPVDPISQNEWAKQRAVRAVVAADGKDREGVPSEDAHKDTIAVYATPADDAGYFGLTSYLRYAEKQLQLSFEWAQRSNVKHGTKYFFPWRAIDKSAVGLKDMVGQFKFTIDQQKVLDLLTGHTLYNDTNVVLRELLQNSIDAVRLQFGARAPECGRVDIRWDSKARTLEICDNGTGMTQSVIENNLLRTGSSRYQDPEFKKRHPDFAPISRFGIGVLSTFMVADQVEIITCHPDEEEARQLSLRSVHGDYLVHKLDKGQDLPEAIRHHGTLVRLTLRPSAELAGVTGTARHFVVLPACKVTVQEDDGEVQSIGYASIKEALTDLLTRSRWIGARGLERGRTKIVESSIGEMSIAFAVGWNKYFSEWDFLSPVRVDGSDAGEAVGVCVGGVRVQSSAPGYWSGGPILAIANTSGANSPRTNVARTALEPTPEQEEFVRACYRAYCDHVVDEIQQLHTQRGFSITWAAEEAAIIAHPLLISHTSPTSRTALRDAVRRIPFFLIEEDGERKCVTADELRRFEELETTESAVTEHVEHLLRELPGGTRESVVALLGARSGDAQTGRVPVLCSHLGRHSEVDGLFLHDWEIGRVTGDIANRACTVGWVRKGERPRWTSAGVPDSGLGALDREIDRTGALSPLVRIPIGDVDVEGFSGDMRGFIVGDTRHLLPGHPWSAMVDELTSSRSTDAKERLELLCRLISQRVFFEESEKHRIHRRYFSVAELEEIIKRVGLYEMVDWSTFGAICRSPESAVTFFDTRKWSRWQGGY
ncbi:ATP-binding protein [Kitasatospora sp. NPDC097605]|uniref:HD domain-containing protein n=1 Tax=Kitasatospora sp. NPDC097605 TaxID=3157226 RepID=UPI00331812A9